MVSGNSVAREQNFNIPQGSEPQQGTGQRRANNKVKPASEHKVHTRIPPAQHYWSIHLPDRRRWRNRSSTRTKINKQTWFFPKLECCHKTNICAERLIDCTRPIKPTKGRLRIVSESQVEKRYKNTLLIGQASTIHTIHFPKKRFRMWRINYQSWLDSVSQWK